MLFCAFGFSLAFEISSSPCARSSDFPIVSTSHGRDLGRVVCLHLHHGGYRLVLRVLLLRRDCSNAPTARRRKPETETFLD